MTNLIGATLGPYHIVREIGRGGMAIVYEAYQGNLARPVAIKMLLPHFSADPSFVQRFLREAWYGRAVKIEEVVVFYRTSNDLNAYITDTRMYRFLSTSTQSTIFSDSTDRTSTADASYTIPVTVNNVLSDTRPGVGLSLNLSFINDTDYVQIGGIRIRLGHHSLN